MRELQNVLEIAIPSSWPTGIGMSLALYQLADKGARGQENNAT